jgi:hypothetical protein
MSDEIRAVSIEELDNVSGGCDNCTGGGCGCDPPVSCSFITPGLAECTVGGHKGLVETYMLPSLMWPYLKGKA